MIHTTTGDNDWASRVPQSCQELSQIDRTRSRTVWRHSTVALITAHQHLAFLGVDLTLLSLELKMHRARTTGRRFAKRARDQFGKPFHIVDGDIQLGVRGERWQIIGLLVQILVALTWFAATSHCNYR